MPSITVKDLHTILEEKLAPLNQKLYETIQAISFINQKYEEILKKLSLYEEERKDLVNENKSIKVELRDTTKKLKDLMDRCDDLEQYSRRECVEIRGIPLPANPRLENTNEIVMKVADLMEVDVKDEDISVSHRLKTSESYHGRNIQAPPIIVKFTRRAVKEKLYKARKKLTGLSTKDLGYNTEQNIYIAESLTQKNKVLFKEAYKVKKDKQFKFIWTSSSKIYLRRSESSPVHLVKNMNDLQKIKG